MIERTRLVLPRVMAAGFAATLLAVPAGWVLAEIDAADWAFGVVGAVLSGGALLSAARPWLSAKRSAESPYSLSFSSALMIDPAYLRATRRWAEEVRAESAAMDRAAGAPPNRLLLKRLFRTMMLLRVLNQYVLGAFVLVGVFAIVLSAIFLPSWATVGATAAVGLLLIRWSVLVVRFGKAEGEATAQAFGVSGDFESRRESAGPSRRDDGENSE
ncbi:MAG TPA: hypothetical protein VF587_20515 [Solirubrobacteraceae bacterium]|jgi:hypothetical protein